MPAPVAAAAAPPPPMASPTPVPAATAAAPQQQQQQQSWLSEAATLAPTPAATAPPPPLDAAATPLPAATAPPPDAAATPLAAAAPPPRWPHAQLGELPRKAREATRTTCTNRFIRVLLSEQKTTFRLSTPSVATATFERPKPLSPASARG